MAGGLLRKARSGDTTSSIFNLKTQAGFLAVDMPEANDLTVGIMALVAQQECEAISRRTTGAFPKHPVKCRCMSRIFEK